MWRQIIALVGVVVTIYSYFTYIKTILSGETKPHRVTWAGWSLVAILGIISSIRGGAGVGLLVTGTFGVGLVVIFILSCFPGHGKPGGSKWESIAAAGAAIALLTQLFVDYSPNVGQTVALAADLVFFWPTLCEAWRHPEFEALRPWIIGAFAETLGVIALGNYSYASAAYTVYILAGNLAVIVALTLSRDKHRPWVRVAAPKPLFRRWKA